MSATALAAILALSAGADAQTLAGKTVSGDLVGLDRQTAILRTAAGDTVRVPVADLLQLTLPPAEAPPKGAHTAVELIDGSVLLCSAVAVKGDIFELTMIDNVPVKVPTTAVFTVLRDAHDPKVRQDWQDFLTKRGRLDMVVVRSDEKLNGLEGTFGPGTGDAIEFTPSATGAKRSVRLARAQGLIFVQKPDPDAAAPLCKVTDAVGNLLVAADVVMNADGLTVTTVSGVRVTLPDAKRLAKLDFSKGKLAYLSELAPTRQAVTLATEDDDLYARFVRYRKDQPGQPAAQGRRQAVRQGDRPARRDTARLHDRRGVQGVPGRPRGGRRGGDGEPGRDRDRGGRAGAVPGSDEPEGPPAAAGAGRPRGAGAAGRCPGHRPARLRRPGRSGGRESEQVTPSVVIS